MRADPLSYPDVHAHHRRFAGMHSYRLPIERREIMAGHLPDPRETPEPRPDLFPTIFWACALLAGAVGFAFICSVA